MSVAKCVRTSAAVLGVLLVAEAAYAADLYSYGGYKDQPIPQGVPTPFWQGFYGGAHIGGLWSTVDAADNVVFVVPNVAVQANQSASVSGLFGGAQAGYNFETGNFLYGIEADLGGMDNGATHTFTLPVPARSITVSSHAGWYGDVTARGGFLYGDALFYAKGGFAFFTGGVNVADAADGISQNSGAFTGWTIGAGLEYLISPRWSVKAEYLYFDLGNNNCCFSSALGRFDDSITMHTVKVGFNFFLHSGLTPLN